MLNQSREGSLRGIFCNAYFFSQWMNTFQLGTRHARTNDVFSTEGGWKTMSLLTAVSIRASNAKRAEKHGSSIDQMFITVLKRILKKLLLFKLC